MAGSSYNGVADFERLTGGQRWGRKGPTPSLAPRAPLNPSRNGYCVRRI
jgi:hypothetical protein